MQQSIPVVTAPPSKSMSHRAMIASALAVGESKLSGVLESDDLERTRECLVACGAQIERTGEGTYDVRGLNGVPAGGPVDPLDLDVGESGTTCRLLTGILPVGLGVFRIFGRGRMHDRPVAALTDVLSGHGVDITFDEKPGYPPFVIKACGLRGGDLTIGLDESSQYLSGLLLAAPIARQQLNIYIGGKKVVSWPYVGLTLQTLKDFGICFRVEKKNENGEWLEVDWRTPGHVEPGILRFHVVPGMYQPQEYAVEGDWSNASYFLAAGAAGPGPVSVRGLRKDSLQGDRAILELLERMGAQISWTDDVVTVHPGQLRGIEADMGSCPDIVPTISVVAAMAQGPTRISNVAHLRIKESDRLAAVAQELSRTGCQVDVLEDGLHIQPAPLPAGGDAIRFSAHGDHRIAMSMALLQRAGVRVELDQPECVAKSNPRFWEQWNDLMQA